MRFPKPPWGMVSWFGKKRSYESSPISGRCSMVWVSRKEPSLRASESREWPPQRRSRRVLLYLNENAPTRPLHERTGTSPGRRARPPARKPYRSPRPETSRSHRAGAGRCLWLSLVRPRRRIHAGARSRHSPGENPAPSTRRTLRVVSDRRSEPIRSCRPDYSRSGPSSRSPTAARVRLPDHERAGA